MPTITAEELQDLMFSDDAQDRFEMPSAASKRKKPLIRREALPLVI